jgi:23S rRNA (pseudouridine1915-N3)-methyltransferase
MYKIYICCSKSQDCYIHSIDHFSKLLSYKTEIIYISSKHKDELKRNLDENQSIKDILEKSKNAFNIALDLSGKNFTSDEFAKEISIAKVNYGARINFFIGGPYGISRENIKLCNLLISLSSMTYNHLIALIVLLEQLYRAECINSNKKYHR